MSRRVLTLLVVGLLALATLTMVRTGSADQRTLVANFPRTTSLYAGAKVKVLGVPVGTVRKITVVGTSVDVSITYDADVKLPADVHAMIVPPSIVGDRYIQLAPVYRKGAVLPDRARLGADRTGVPIELDETYAALDKLAAGLGPDGANKDGALSRLVTATAKNLTGHGAAFNQTVRELAGAVSTVAGSSEDISQSVRNLSLLTNTLAGKDAQLRSLVANLARVGAQLNGQGGEISAAVAELQASLGQVARFTKANRAAIRTGIAGATDVSGVLARRTKELKSLLDLTPVGFSNLANIYLPKNWDPSKPWLTPVGGRTGSANLRAALFSDLDTQLGYTLGGLCAVLPAAQQQQLSSFCSTLTSVGGNLGALISRAIERGGFTPSRGPGSLIGLLGGPR